MRYHLFEVSLICGTQSLKISFYSLIDITVISNIVNAKLYTRSIEVVMFFAFNTANDVFIILDKHAQKLSSNT